MYSRVNQSYIYIFALFFRFLSQIGEYRELSSVPVLYSRPLSAGGASGKESASSAGDTRDRVRSLGWGDALEEGTAIHSSVLACRISRVTIYSLIILSQFGTSPFFHAWF